jgi:hypothetical protein
MYVPLILRISGISPGNPSIERGIFVTILDKIVGNPSVEREMPVYR